MKHTTPQRRSDGTMQHPAPSPRPTTPVRGEGFTDVSFTSSPLRQLAQAARAKSNSRYAIIKPKRVSQGLLWNGRPFYWTKKGFYRGGTGDRRPLQHLVWESVNGPMPEKHEIWFKDRDRHNFTPANLECISKSELHRRTVENGEVKQITEEQRAQMAGTRWTRHARKNTALLLKSFNTKDSNEHHSKLQFLTKRQQTFNHGPEQI